MYQVDHVNVIETKTLLKLSLSHAAESSTMFRFDHKWQAANNGGI